MVLIEARPLVVSTFIVEHLVRELRILDRRASPVQFGRRADEDADFVRNDALLRPCRQPLADGFDLFLWSLQNHDVRLWTVER